LYTSYPVIVPFVTEGAVHESATEPEVPSGIVAVSPVGAPATPGAVAESVLEDELFCTGERPSPNAL
jgi:hypothetical protein